MKKVILTVLTLATVFVGCNKNEIEGLERDLALEKTYNRGLRNEVNNLSASLETANMSISDLEAVVTDAERQISSLNADLELGAAEKAQLIADYDTIIADAEARIDELTVSLADALAQIEDLIANPIVIVRYREVVRTVIEVVERVVVETVIGDQAAIDALNVTIDALNARIAELEADTTNTELIAELRLTISALESQLANIDTTASTGVVTGTIVFYIDGDLNRADGAERYFQTLDLVKFALGTNIVAPETSYDIYTIIENDGVYSGAELLITLVSTYVAPSQGQVDNDGDNFTADVDLDDADASIGDQATEDAKAQAIADAAAEVQRLADGLAAAPWTPAFGTQIAKFSQTKTFETESDAREITITEEVIPATPTNEAGTRYIFSHGGGSHDVPGAVIVADLADVWNVTLTNQGGESAGLYSAGNAVTQYNYDGGTWGTLSAAQQAAQFANTDPGTTLVQLGRRTFVGQVEAFNDTYDVETLTVNGVADVAGTVDGQTRNVNVQPKASIPAADLIDVIASVNFNVVNAAVFTSVDVTVDLEGFSGGAFATVLKDSDFADVASFTATGSGNPGTGFDSTFTINAAGTYFFYAWATSTHFAADGSGSSFTQALGRQIVVAEDGSVDITNL